MKKVLFGLSLLALTSVAFAGSRNDVKAETPAKSETKDQDMLYWFDANNGQYLGRSEESGCDNSDLEPCAKGYRTVANPSTPVQPSGTPTAIETGKH